VAVLTVLPSGGGTGEVIAQWDFNNGTLNPSTGSGSAGYTGGTTANAQGEFASGSSSDPTLGDNLAWNTSTSLRDDGFRHLREGHTTMEEILRVTKDDTFGQFALGESAL